MRVVCLMINIYALLYFFSFQLQATEHNSNIMNWAKAKLPTTFPQTYIINQQLAVEYARLGFHNQQSYVASITSKKSEPNYDSTKLIEYLKHYNAPLWSQVKTKLSTTKHIILTISINKDIAHCETCEQQKSLLEDNRYFGMPHYTLILSSTK